MQQPIEKIQQPLEQPMQQPIEKIQQPLEQPMQQPIEKIQQPLEQPMQQPTPQQEEKPIPNNNPMAGYQKSITSEPTLKKPTQ